MIARRRLLPRGSHSFQVDVNDFFRKKKGPFLSRNGKWFRSAWSGLQGRADRPSGNRHRYQSDSLAGRQMRLGS